MKELEVEIDEDKGEMFFQGISLLMGTRRAFTEHQRKIEEILGPSAKLIFYTTGKKYSRDMFYQLLNRHKDDFESMSVKETISALLDFLPKMGYGVFTLEDYGDVEGNRIPKEFFVEVENCFNAVGYENTDKPICYIVSGVLAGLFEIIFDREVKCEEVECKGMGHSEKCRFRIMPTEHYVRNIFSSYFENGDMEKRVKRKLKKEVLLLDEDKGEVFYRGIDNVMMPREVIARFERETERIIGPAAKSLYYTGAKKAAKEATEKILKTSFPAKLLSMASKEKFFSELYKVAKVRGYGLMKLMKYNKKNMEGTVRVENCCNAKGYGNEEKSICYTISGMLAGTGEALYNRKMACVETKCMGKGDPYCEFNVFQESRIEVLEELLESFKDRIYYIEGLLLLTSDGSLLASALPKKLDPEKFAAMSATISGSAVKAMSELKKETINKVIIEAKKVSIITQVASENAILVSMVKPKVVDLGLVLLDMEKISEKIDEVIG